jgi:hypothetical protein
MPAARLAMAALGKRECNAMNAVTNCTVSVYVTVGHVSVLEMTDFVHVCTYDCTWELHSCVIVQMLLRSVGDGCHCNKQRRVNCHLASDTQQVSCNSIQRVEPWKCYFLSEH